MIAAASGRGAAMSPPPLDLVIDTNVLLDWLAFRHPVGTAIEEALRSGRCRWLWTRPMRDELAHVIARESPRRWAIDASAVLSVFDALGVDAGNPGPVAGGAALRCTDADDQKFIDLAVARGAHALLTRDRAVLRLASRARRQGLLIATPEVWLGPSIDRRSGRCGVSTQPGPHL